MNLASNQRKTSQTCQDTSEFHIVLSCPRIAQDELELDFDWKSPELIAGIVAISSGIDLDRNSISSVNTCKTRWQPYVACIQQVTN